MSSRMPVFFLSHGGGPWPWLEDRRRMFDRSLRTFSALPERLPARPRAVLMISGHWEEPAFTVTTSAEPPMEYDYYNFPEHTYRIRYAAPGSPALAARVQSLLAGAGIACDSDPERGFDHGAFVPMSLMYPAADVPLVQLALKSGYDPAEHIRVGAALAPLRDEGVLIIGSGLTYHNMPGFRSSASLPVSQLFEAYLNEAVTQPDPALRNQMLTEWSQAPAARDAHPREDHLLPLMVAAGAAGTDRGSRLLVEYAMNVIMVSYQFPAAPLAAASLSDPNTVNHEPAGA
ncbi:MAG: class III extradiol ring-cleavage dioxygenase [Spongiibacteraceae bacterium]|nr:class III extradiol ring-cleavage dioxygenase [Spongiibacteraceae bacterium]